jgi:atypical dual specificity phosphatase
MKITWIEDGILAASSMPVGVTDLRWLQGQGIGAILSLTENPLTTQTNVDAHVFEELDVVYYHAPILDGDAPDRETARTLLDFLEQMQTEGRATLAHCQAGIGRTGTILHLYYLAQGHDLETAKERVRDQRITSSWENLSNSQQAFLADVAANGLG